LVHFTMLAPISILHVYCFRVPLKYLNPNCTLCHNNDKDTWPPLLSTCEHPHLKRLRIARHNKATHLITQTLHANKNTRFYTDKCWQLKQPPARLNSPRMASLMHMPTTTLPMPSQIKTRHPMHHWCPNQIQTPFSPSPNYTIQLIEFTYCHDIFPEQAITHKHTKYDPLINNIQNTGWKTNPLITINIRVRGAIHEHSIEQLNKLKIPKSNIKTPMKNLHHNSIKYLTYLVLNKRKLDNKQTPVLPP
jgi:hypothetical protein